MSLGDDWYFDFDQFTIESKLQSVNFGVFASSDRDILPSDLNKIEFSLVKFESTLMRHFVAQFNSIYSFLNNESTTNENAHFQRFARKMLNYIKAEMHYCFTFWQSEKHIDYLGHRLNATLLRTYYFLLELQMNVCKRVPNQNRSYWHADESLEDLSEYFAVKYQDLGALLQSFEKLFEELYHKVSPLVRTYPLEVNLIVAIWTTSNMFFTFSYNDIVKVCSSKFSSAEETKFVERILMSNEMTRMRAEQAKKKTFEEEQRERREYLSNEMYNSKTISSISQEFDQQSYYLVNNAVRNMRENAVRFEADEDNIAIRTKGNFLERLRQNAQATASMKKSIPRRTSHFESLLSSDTSPQKILNLMQLNSVKDSPNNPLARNTIIHSLISDTGDEHDFLIKVPKENVTLNRQITVSHFGQDVLSKLESDARDTQSQRELETSGYYSTASTKKSTISKVEFEEDEYLRIMNQKLGEFRTSKDQQDSSEDPVNTRKNRGIFKSIQIMSHTSLTLGDPTSKMPKDSDNGEKDRAAGEDSDHSRGDDEEEKKKRREKAFKKKYGVDEDEMKKMIAEAESIAPHQPSKENKGDDIPDEDVLGDLLEQDSYTESDKKDSDDDDDTNSQKSSKRSSKNSDTEISERKRGKNRRHRSGSPSGDDDEDENDENEDHEDDEEALERKERERRKREKELRDKALAQLAVSKNDFNKFLSESVAKEPKDIKSKYFVPKRNFLFLNDHDNINASRHTSKWCFLQDNYKYQSIEKEAMAHKNEDYSFKTTPMTVERQDLKMKLKMSVKTLSRPFVFAKQNPISIFNTIAAILLKDQMPIQKEQIELNFNDDLM